MLKMCIKFIYSLIQSIVNVHAESITGVRSGKELKSNES